MKKIPMLLVVSAGITASVHAAPAAPDILGYYTKLAEAGIIQYVIEKRDGLWTYIKLEENGETLESDAPPVIDIRNGYIGLKYSLAPCSFSYQIALFIGARKEQRFVALRADNECIDGLSHSLRFYRPEVDSLVEMPDSPVGISFRDFVDEKALAASEDALKKFQSEGLLAVRFDLPQLGTDVNAYPVIFDYNVGISRETVKEAIEFDRLHRKYAKIVLKWNPKALKFEIGKKIPK